MVIPGNLISALMFWPISQTSLWKGSLQMRSSVLLWYWQISQSATVCGQWWHGFWVLSALVACVPPCEGGVCPQETLPGLDDPFLFVLGPMVGELLVTSILPLWPVVLGQESAWEVLLVEPLLGPLHSFLLPEILQVPLLCAGNVGFPLLGGFLVSPRASGTP